MPSFELANRHQIVSGAELRRQPSGKATGENSADAACNRIQLPEVRPG